MITNRLHSNLTGNNLSWLIFKPIIRRSLYLLTSHRLAETINSQKPVENIKPPADNQLAVLLQNISADNDQVHQCHFPRSVAYSKYLYQASLTHSSKKIWIIYWCCQITIPLYCDKKAPIQTCGFSIWPVCRNHSQAVIIICLLFTHIPFTNTHALSLSRSHTHRNWNVRCPFVQPPCKITWFICATFCCHSVCARDKSAPCCGTAR